MIESDARLLDPLSLVAWSGHYAGDKLQAGAEGLQLSVSM
jgi:hypothetical protein